MKLIYDHLAGRYVFRSTYAEFQKAPMGKDAGFAWDKAAKEWHTGDVEKAMRLAQYADAPCRERLAGRLQEARAAIVASQQVDAEVDIPAPPGLSYMPFQKAGIAYALRVFGDLD